jgi:hypothetical protein
LPTGGSDFEKRLAKVTTKNYRFKVALSARRCDSTLDGRTTYRYQWLCDVPLRGDAKAMTVNWLMIEILDADGEVTYRNSFITDMPVNRENVAELAACGRARWKIENEGFNTLKTKGYHPLTHPAAGQNP